LNVPKRFAVASLLALVGGLLWGQLAPSPPDRIVFVAVGQGDCTVLQSEGYTALIDCGPANEFVDAGREIVDPELEALGAHAVDLLILTHPDADHVGGIVSVARRFSVGKVVIPAGFRNDAVLLKRFEDAGLSGSQVMWLKVECTVRLGRFALRLDPPPYSPNQPDNEGSMFTRVEEGRATAVLSGDAPAKTELEVLGEGEDWNAQLLHVGHHGSETSSCEAWLTSVRPAIGVISCGRNNIYHHPRPATLERLAADGIEVHRTDVEGTLEYRVSPGGFVRAR